MKQTTLTGFAIAALCIAIATPRLSADHAERNDNPDLPERSATGRISAREFFARFPDQQLQLISRCKVANDDFGIYHPGERLETSFMVMAAGTKIGLNHKSAPAPTYEMRCKLPGSKEKFISIVPDRGFT